VDNDGDALVDYPADPGCNSLAGASEAGACQDGVDNDGDGLVDFPADPGCTSAADLSEREAGNSCDDGIDNDADTFADYPADAGCDSLVDPSERSPDLVCDDGLDNDGDGLVDHPADPGCASLTDPSERSPDLVCDDGADNDTDTSVDYPADAGCDSLVDPSEQSPDLVCDDGLDNDGDELVDYPADSGCWGARDRTETPTASAGLLDFTGTLKIEMNHLCSIGYFRGCSGPGSVLGTAVIPGSGTAAVNRSGAGGRLAALGVVGSEFAIASHLVPVTDPDVFPIAGVQFTAGNDAGDFSGAGGDAFGGVMPIHGVMKLCLFGSGGCSQAIANVTLPLSVVGQGGTATAVGPINLTVKGAPWTTGTAAIGTSTAMGGVSPLSSTATAGGHVSLVTPIFISTNVGSYAVLPTFGILDLDFIPEPGTLLLGGAAIASLVALGIARLRHANQTHR